MKQNALFLGSLQVIASSSAVEGTTTISATFEDQKTVGRKSIFLYSVDQWTKWSPDRKGEEEIQQHKNVNNFSQLPTVENVMNFCYNTKGPGEVGMEPVQFTTQAEEALSAWNVPWSAEAFAVIGEADADAKPEYRRFHWLSNKASLVTFSKWIGGTPVDGAYTNWAKNFPNETKHQNGNDRLCVRKMSNTPSSGWQNIVCDGNYHLQRTRYILCQSRVDQSAVVDSVEWNDVNPGSNAEPNPNESNPTCRTNANNKKILQRSRSNIKLNHRSSTHCDMPDHQAAETSGSDPDPQEHVPNRLCGTFFPKPQRNITLTNIAKSTMDCAIEECVQYLAWAVRTEVKEDCVIHLPEDSSNFPGNSESAWLEFQNWEQRLLKLKTPLTYPNWVVIRGAGEDLERKPYTLIKVPDAIAIRAKNLYRVRFERIAFFVGSDAGISTQGIVEEKTDTAFVLRVDKSTDPEKQDFPTMEILNRTTALMNLNGTREKGKYVRAYRYSDDEKECHIRSGIEQVPWSRWERIRADSETADYYRFHMSVESEVRKARWDKYENGMLVGIKRKYQSNDPYRINGGQHIRFYNVQWVQQARGVIRPGRPDAEGIITTSDITFENCKIQPPPPHIRASFPHPPCLMSTSGGPQIGQPFDKPVVRNVVIQNFYAINTGDDSLGFFNAPMDGVTFQGSVTIKDSFMASILFHNSPVSRQKNRALWNIDWDTVQCDEGPKPGERTQCGDELMNDVHLRGRPMRGRGSLTRRGSRSRGFGARRPRAREQGRRPRDSAPASRPLPRGRGRAQLHTTGQRNTEMMLYSKCTVGGLSCAVFYPVLLVTLLVVMLSSLVWIRCKSARQDAAAASAVRVTTASPIKV